MTENAEREKRSFWTAAVICSKRVYFPTKPGGVWIFEQFSSCKQHPLQTYENRDLIEKGIEFLVTCHIFPPVYHYSLHLHKQSRKFALKILFDLATLGSKYNCSLIINYVDFWMGRIGVSKVYSCSWKYV